MANCKRPDFMNNILDECFHKNNPICQIIPTNTKKVEDRFNSFRPAPDTCLDYSISQTDAKLDAGDTKIHVKQTTARYIPNLNSTQPLQLTPKQKKNRYFKGGPPQWEFLEEIWLRQQEKKQIRYKIEFKKRVRLRKKLEQNQLNREHDRIMSLVGPLWYQELSPKQIATVEKLKSCILKDLTDNTIINSQENIAELGLVLRPNPNHIAKALKNCCKCPEEFLLTLYQLINPARTKYSINDRLLLSAVVHITMKETLKELHIRIPSPPPPPRSKPKQAKITKRIKYESPYLQPFTFLKEAKLFSGIYKNKHVQRPTSPYFCYLVELEKLRETESPNIDNKRRRSLNEKAKEESPKLLDEIDKELQVAQSVYESLVDFRPVPTLLKPSVYIPCDNLRNQVVRSSNIQELSDETKYICCLQKRTISCDCSPDDFVPVDSSEDDENCCGIKKIPPCILNCQNIQKKQKTCTCKKKSKNVTEKEPCFCVDTDEKGRQTTTISLVAGVKETESKQLVPILGGVTVIPKYCDCTNKYQVKLEEMRKKKKKQRQQRKKQKEEAKNRNSKLYCLSQTLKRRKTCSSCIENTENTKPKPCECKKKSQQLMQLPLCQCERCQENRKQKTTFTIINGLKETESKQLIPIIGGVTVQTKKCDCLQNYNAKIAEYKKEKEEAKTHKYQMENEPKKNQKEDNVILPFPTKKSEENYCPHEREIQKFNQMYPLIRPEKRNLKTCKCQKKYRKLIDEPLCDCNICEEERKKKNTTAVILGMKQTQPDETIPIIDQVFQEKRCDCLKKYEEKLENLKREKLEEIQTPCGCKQVVKQLSQMPLCQCEKCQEDRRMKAAKFIIAGTKEKNDQNLEIIEGISMGRKCNCIYKYDKRIKEYQDFKKRTQAVVDLKNLKEKFIISGISHTPLGPVYQISGLRPKIDCACCKKARQDAKDKHMQAIMPHVPPGRIQYSIVGVHKTPTENVYILDRALPIKECDCMKLYKEFELQHSTCTQLYEDFLNLMKDEYNQFMNDILPLNEGKPESLVSELSIDKEDILERKNDNFTETIQETCTCVETQPVEVTCSCVESPVCDFEETEYDQAECVDSAYGIKETIEVIEEKLNEPQKLKRFFIFDKILNDAKWQRMVLKKALKSMADDGFPLAKLPQVYKLPHFRLWMQMRCRSFWNQEFKYNSVFKSRDYWRHCSHCRRWKTIFPKLQISKSKAALLDWSKATYCKKLVNDVFETFYRRSKQNRINFGREFFPATFTYEFPFNSWRDCYFAYTDSKEEEVHARFVWQKYDYKNVADMKRLCCGI